MKPLKHSGRILKEGVALKKPCRITMNDAGSRGVPLYSRNKVLMVFEMMWDEMEK
jgi:hypothetical protein